MPYDSGHTTGSEFFTAGDSVQSTNAAAVHTLAELNTKEFLERLFTQFREPEEWTKRCRDSSAQQVLYAFMDKLLVDENEEGLLEIVKLKEGEVCVSIPIMGAMMRMNLKERLKSNPGWSYYRGNGSVARAAVARLCSAIVDDFSGEFFIQEFEQGDHLTLMAFGTTLWELKWNADSGPQSAPHAEKNVRTLAEAESVCPQCAFKASGYLEGQPCPKDECNGSMVGMHDIRAVRNDGKTTYHAGALQIRAVNGFSWNTQSGMREWRRALWLSEDTIDDVAHLANEHDEAELRGGESMLDEHFLHLRRMRAVERVQAGINPEYTTLRDHRETLTERERVVMNDYVKPITYAGFLTKKNDESPVTFTIPQTVEDMDGNVLAKGTEIHKGEMLPPGVPLTLLFPDGFHARRTHTEHLIWANVNLHDRFVIGRREVVDGCIWGKSVAGVLELQYALDEIGTVLFTYANEQAMPTMFFDEAIVGDQMGIGGRLNRIPAGTRPRDVSMRDLVVWAPPGQLGEAVLALPQMIKEDMQMCLGAFSPFGSSLPQAAEGTATGMSITEQAAASQQGLVLGLVAQTKGKAIELGLRLFNRHADEDRYFTIGGPYTALAPVIAIQGKDIPDDIKVIVKRNSAFPRELYQQQANMIGYAQAIMAYAQAKMLVGQAFDMDDLAHIGELFQIDIVINAAEVQSEIAQERIMKALDFLVRCEQYLKHQKKGALLPEERQVIETTRKHLQIAQQQNIQQMITNRPIDPNTGQQVPIAPEQQAQVAEMMRDAETPPPDILFVAAADALVPVREQLDEHAMLAGFTKKWAQTYEGRNLNEWCESWLSERFATHQQHAIESQAQQAGMQQAAVQRALAPTQNAQFMQNMQMQAVGQALAPQQQAGAGASPQTRQQAAMRPPVPIPGQQPTQPSL